MVINFKLSRYGQIKARMSTLTTPFEHCIGILATAIKQEKQIKCTQIEKEKNKSLITDGMIFYRENPKKKTNENIQ